MRLNDRMSTICANCGTMIKGRAHRCPKCDQPLKQPSTEMRK